MAFFSLSIFFFSFFPMSLASIMIMFINCTNDVGISPNSFLCSDGGRWLRALFFSHVIGLFHESYDVMVDYFVCKWWDLCMPVTFSWKKCSRKCRSQFIYNLQKLENMWSIVVLLLAKVIWLLRLLLLSYYYCSVATYRFNILLRNTLVKPCCKCYIYNAI